MEFDALVIGAGAGGLFAAARLSHLGYRTLVVERLDRVGGRASTYDIDGFKVNNGALVLELGGIVEETFAELGAEYGLRKPEPPILYRVKGKDVDITRGGWGVLLSQLTRSGAKVLQGLGSARQDSGLPEEEITTAEWLAKFTKNEDVHAVFRNMCCSVFAVGSEELPARVFLTYFTRKSAFKKFGMHPQGTIGPFLELARVVDRNGGEVWLDSEVTSLTVTDGQVTGAVVRRGEEEVTVRCKFAVSDVGPAATVGLVGAESFPAGYLEEVRRRDRPSSMITVNVASRERLIKAPGLLLFGKTRRMCYIVNFTDLCPEMAPEGWHLYAAAGVPRPAVGAFDEETEKALLMEDLREQVPGFDDARILSVAVMKDEWPPQRAVAGFDMPQTTPIPNLWNVGDGVKEYANGGTTACAETAKLVVERITKQYG
ncbi:phytoene desaturase family protein [Nonomuraea wenchangensis]|uniref:phytoene desaturase family protein n=1 Tax=Nonomuraea wenchangensis TaxID=568860 RepID=UPI00384B6B1A